MVRWHRKLDFPTVQMAVIHLRSYQRMKENVLTEACLFGDQISRAGKTFLRYSWGLKFDGLCRWQLYGLLVELYMNN